jgi:hypothetical protein
MGKLAPLKSVLIPDRVTGKLIFWEKPSAPHPNGRRIDLPFTRSGGTRTVINGGIIQDVAADVPAWISDGECRVDFEPAVTQIQTLVEPSSGGTNVTFTSWPTDLGLTNAIVFGDNSVGRLYTFSATTGNPSGTCVFFVRMDDLSEPRLGGDGPNVDFVILLNAVVATEVGKQYIGDGVWRVWGKGVIGASSNRLQKSTGNSPKGFVAGGFNMYALPYPVDYIPTAATKPQDVSTSTPIAEGLITATEGTILVRLNVYDLLGLGANMLQLGVSTQSMFVMARSSSVVSAYPLIALYNASFNKVAEYVFTQEENAFALRWDASGWSLHINGAEVDEGVDAINFADNAVFRGSNKWQLLQGSSFAPYALTKAECNAATTL